jgi:glycosyltransferase involved in cell wall biosynthesis
MRTHVIVPAWNEEESLPRVLAEVRECAPWADVVVVDDGSTDGTQGVARTCGVPVLALPINLGVGGALQTGFLYALAEGYDVAVQLDADGQHDPANLAALIAPLAEGRANLSIGSRYVRGASEYHAPFLRRLGILLFSALASAVTGFRFTDTTSGYRAYDRRVMRLCLNYFPQDFPDAPLLIWVARTGSRLVEVPVAMRPRLSGQSFYTWTRSLYYPYKTLVASLVLLLRRAPRLDSRMP